MAQRIGSRHVVELGIGQFAERSARACEQDFLYLVVALAHNALEDGRVLTVDRQDGHTMLLSQLADEFACHDQRLFVGQTDFLTGFDGVDRRREARESDHRREYHVDGFGLDNLVDSFAAGIDLNVGQVVQCFAEWLVVLFVGNHHGCRLEASGLFGQQFPTAVGRQCIDLEAVAVLVDDVECLCADGAGRA